MAFPAFIDEVAFASLPFDSPQVYTTLHDSATLKRTRLRSWKRGRQNEDTPTDTGTSSLVFENMDRALDAANVASIYYPNVLPMRRTRSRVARALPADAVLTVSGNEITDALRALLVQGDGRLSDSSFGIWEAATNLVANGGFETNSTGWAGFGAARSTSQSKFGAASFKATAAPQFQGSNFSSHLAVTPSLTYTASVWVFAAAGVQLRLGLQEYNASNALVGETTVLVTPNGAWVRVTATRAFGATGTQADIKVINMDPAAQDFYMDGVQLEQKSIATPYVHTDGGTATRAVSRVQAVPSLFSTAQGFVAGRVRMGFPSTSVPTSSPRLFGWRQDANNRMDVRINTNGTFQLTIVDAVHGDSAISGVFAWVAGDFVTIAAYWTATTVAISINGGAFTTVARTAFPTITTALPEFGTDGQGAAPLDGDVMWFAGGTGTLTDADAATINAYGNTDPADPTFANFPEPWQITATWAALTSAYRVAGDAICFTTYVDPEQGWQLDNSQAGYSEAIAAANDGFDILSTYLFLATDSFASQTPGARVNAVLDAVGWSATERAVDTSAEQLTIQALTAGSITGMSALDVIQDVVRTEDGIFFVDGRGYAVFQDRYHKLKSTRSTTSQATFCDKANYTTGFFMYESLPPLSSPIVNDWLVTAAGGTQQDLFDSSAINTFRRRSKSVDTLHLTNADAAAFGSYKLAGSKDPHRRYDEMVLKPGDDASLWITIFRLEIGDRITVLQSPVGGGAPDVRDMYIEAIDVTVGPAGTATVTYRLSPAGAVVGWVMGDAQYSLLGTSTYMVY